MLGQQKRYAVLLGGDQARQGGEAAAGGVRHAVARRLDRERPQGVLQQVGGVQRVVHGGPGDRGGEVLAGPHVLQGAQGALAAQRRAEQPAPGEVGEAVQLGAEVGGVDRVQDGVQKALVGVQEAAHLLAARCLALRGRAPQRGRGDRPHVGGQLPGQCLVSGTGDGDDVELDVRHALYELVAPDTHTAVLVRVRPLGEQGDAHSCPPSCSCLKRPAASAGGWCRWRAGGADPPPGSPV